MINLNELNPKGFALTKDQQANLKVLHRAMNLVRHKYGKPMIVSSGVRTIDDHKRIYMEKATKQGIKNPRIPMGSKHLSAQAVDIADKDGSLYRWCKDNEAVLVEANLYCEEGTSGWVHFQCVAPASGNRWFKP
jgi:hypothetical protein